MTFNCDPEVPSPGGAIDSEAMYTPGAAVDRLAFSNRLTLKGSFEVYLGVNESAEVSPHKLVRSFGKWERRIKEESLNRDNHCFVDSFGCSIRIRKSFLLTILITDILVCMACACRPTLYIVGSLVASPPST